VDRSQAADHIGASDLNWHAENAQGTCYLALGVCAVLSGVIWESPVLTHKA
jgi:hypothetical protein